MKIPSICRKRRASTSASKGQRAEQAALDHLKRNGLSLVTRNFHCRLGEVDLVMMDLDCLVFIEVRFRSPGSFMPAALTVDERKQARIARTAAFFLGTNPSLSDHAVRFDIVALDGGESGASRIQWIKDAFRV
jgi:putative endonuclease